MWKGFWPYVKDIAEMYIVGHLADADFVQSDLQ